MKEVDAFVNRAFEPDEQEAAKQSSTVVCAATPGTPVVFVSDAFEAHTGYAPVDIIGKNLAILQGPDTEPEAVARFRTLIKDGTAGLVTITNYRSDGEKFIHECDFRPVRDAQERVTHFVAVQRRLQVSGDTV